MNAIRAFFEVKIYGLRVVEVIAAAMLAVCVVTVYSVKAAADRQGTEAARLARAITAERDRVRLLTAEAARLEEPGRLEALSRRAGLAPASATRRLAIEELPPLTAPAPTPTPVQDHDQAGEVAP